MLRAFLSVPLLFAVFAGAGAAPTAVPQKEELKQLRERIEALQRSLAQTEETQTEVADALRDSERAISAANRTLRDLGEQQRTVNARLGELQQLSKRTSVDIETHQQRLARLLYQQYTGTGPDALKVILNREDPGQIARELYYLGYLSRARAELIRKLRANLGRLDDLGRETVQQSAELAAIQTAQQAQRARLENEKRARQEVFTKVARQIDRQKRQISTLRRDEDRLARLVDQLTRMLARERAARERSAREPAPRERRPAPLRNERVPDSSPAAGEFAQLKGRLHLPVRGELRNRFGTLREGNGPSWKGLFIAAPAGNEVKAIAPGRVVFADWLRGFGNLLIVDHGGSYMSLYGNNESLFKQVGDMIRGGDAVASVGSSGGNQDSGLYFEMRHQGKPFDPLNWVNLK